MNEQRTITPEERAEWRQKHTSEPFYYGHRIAKLLDALEAAEARAEKAEADVTCGDGYKADDCNCAEFARKDAELAQVKAERDALIASLAEDFDCERCALNINEFPCGHDCVEGVGKWAARKAAKAVNQTVGEVTLCVGHHDRLTKQNLNRNETPSAPNSTKRGNLFPRRDP